MAYCFLSSLLDGAKVHGLLDDVKWSSVKRDWVHRFLRPRRICAFAPWSASRGSPSSASSAIHAVLIYLLSLERALRDDLSVTIFFATFFVALGCLGAGAGFAGFSGK